MSIGKWLSDVWFAVYGRDEAIGRSSSSVVTTRPSTRSERSVSPNLVVIESTPVAAAEAANPPIEIKVGENFSEVTAEIASSTKSHEEWLDLLDVADYRSPLEYFVASKVVETSPNNPEAIAEILEMTFISLYEDLKEAAITKLRQVEASFKAWEEVCNGYSGDTESIALAKMIETAATLEDLDSVINRVDEDEWREELTVKLCSFNVTIEECREILDDYASDHFFYNFALDKLLAEAQTTIQILDIYYGWTFEDDDDEKILDKFFSVATRAECGIVSRVAEQDSNIRDRAEAKLKEV
jgi:hypothetical protein